MTTEIEIYFQINFHFFFLCQINLNSHQTIIFHIHIEETPTGEEDFLMSQLQRIFSQALNQGRIVGIYFDAMQNAAKVIVLKEINEGY